VWFDEINKQYENLDYPAEGENRNVRDDKIYSIIDKLHIEAEVRSNRRHHRKARLAYERALEISVKEYGLFSPVRVKCLDEFARQLHWLGEYKEAEKLFRLALKIFVRMPPVELEHHLLRSKVMFHLAHLLQERVGDNNEIELLLRNAVQIIEAEGGADHPDLPAALGFHALALGDLGDDTQSEILLRRAISLGEKLSMNAKISGDTDLCTYFELKLMFHESFLNDVLERTGRSVEFAEDGMTRFMVAVEDRLNEHI
jgi:tetratricopeptide (TPR) repeat protein